MVQFLFLGVRLGVGLADAFGDDLGVAFLMARILAVRTLHSGRVLEKVAAEGASHDVVELLSDEFVSVHLVDLLLALADGTLTI